MNLTDDPRGGTLCLSKAGLGIGSTKPQVKIAAPNGAGVDYAIDGVLYHKADAATIAMTAGQTIADLYTNLILIQLNAAGTLSSVLGTPVLTADLTAGNEVLVWPTPTAANCPIGALKIANATGSTYTTGTTDLDTASLTVTYYDLLAIPPAPLTS